MTEPRQTHDDPLINDVRQRRRDLFRDCGDDLRKLLEIIERRQSHEPDKILDRRKLKVRLPTTPNE